MKEFVVYTALRILLFIASLGMVFGVWALIADAVPVLWVVVVAFLISGVASYYLLNGPRTAFARRVEERAARASAAFEERRSREDVDE
ncbi:DUF4229 domain-containing protein [Nocardioides sp.]|uniref:DUF4229 domain-containing protein n=1 Tax=Nocardioides sp. TaxID=35761 RepID=UPI003569AE5F